MIRYHSMYDHHLPFARARTTYWWNWRRLWSDRVNGITLPEYP